MSEISDTLLRQRIRNRIIENLEMLTDSDSVEKIGTDETLEYWYDYVDENKINFFIEPVFTKSETNLIQQLHTLIEKEYNNIPTTWETKELACNDSWAQVTRKAFETLKTFQKRGYLDEENEIT